jgi:hypothetical protein
MAWATIATPPAGATMPTPSPSPSTIVVPMEVVVVQTTSGEAVHPFPTDIYARGDRVDHGRSLFSPLNVVEETR